MNRYPNKVRRIAVAAALALAAGFASQSTMAADPPMAGLSGAQEVPPNQSKATGKSTLMIAADKSVTGGVEVMGMTATAAHIHEAPAGTNGGVIVPLTKSGDNSFVAPPGAKLTDAQYESYKAGKLYVNVHSAAYPGGEVRMQLGAK